jgi:anti-sigma regulatory factor (Ser/Thr protein kinase)
MTSPRIEVRVPARLEYLGLLRQAALALGEVLPRLGRPAAAREVDAWGLAIYEAATNVVRHGFAGGSDDPIVLAIAIEADRVVFSLSDHGHPNEAWGRSVVPAAGAESGYGLMIIRQVMQEADYVRDAAGRNELRLVARLGGGRPS